MDFLEELLVIYLALFLGYLVHVPVHEAGHLLFGKLSGYRFVSFRIGSLTLLSQQGKLVWRRFRIPGTLGQCLMDPPEPVNGRYPATLYHLGGSLLNFLCSVPCFVAFVLLQRGGDYLLSQLALGVALAGVLLAASNAIPFKVGGIATDGYNALHMGKDPLADKGFWVQLRVNALQSDGARLRDLPEELFLLPPDADLANIHIASWAYFRFCWLLDRQDFSAMEEYAALLMGESAKLLGFYQNELRCELFFLKLLQGAPPAEIEACYDKTVQKHVKATASFLSRQRLLYAYAKLALHDETAAQSALAQFDRLCKTHPYPGDLQAERELLALVDAAA